MIDPASCAISFDKPVLYMLEMFRHSGTADGDFIPYNTPVAEVVGIIVEHIYTDLYTNQYQTSHHAS